MSETLALLMFAGVALILLAGYPVAFSLAGAGLLFAAIGVATGTFDENFLQAIPNRLYGIMTNTVLIAVPLFVFMGVMLEMAKIAEDLLDTMALLFGRLRGGLGISVAVVGMLLAASTGIVGATVVTMGLLSLPSMMKRNYNPALATGTICASGTLGQIIPPSIVLILLGDVISAAYQQAQLNQGLFAPESVSVGDLFAGAMIPGLLLVSLYIVYIVSVAIINPEAAPPVPDEEQRQFRKGLIKRTVRDLFPALFLIVAVLGSILAGIATPTEAASVGAVGAIILAVFRRTFNLKVLRNVMRQTVIVSSMVFLILIGASVFSLVFRGFGGDEMIADFLTDLPGGKVGAILLVMLVMFLLGFILDFIEITFVIVPIVGPVLLTMDISPVWLGIMIAVNLQTSFLTPPFGFSLFYLRGVAPPEIQTTDIYRGVMPFIVIQLIVLVLLWYFPELATWLPNVIYG